MLLRSYDQFHRQISITHGKYNSRNYNWPWPIRWTKSTLPILFLMKDGSSWVLKNPTAMINTWSRTWSKLHFRQGSQIGDPSYMFSHDHLFSGSTIRWCKTHSLLWYISHLCLWFDFENNIGFNRNSDAPPVLKFAFQYTVIIRPEASFVMYK